jgi:hypothetical protein
MKTADSCTSGRAQDEQGSQWEGIENAPLDGGSERQLVEVFPPRIWAEKDMCGTVHIKMRHHGWPVFDFIQIQYRYGYTDNAAQHSLTTQIMAMLGVEDWKDYEYPADYVAKAVAALTPAQSSSCATPEGHLRQGERPNEQG